MGGAPSRSNSRSNSSSSLASPRRTTYSSAKRDSHREVGSQPASPSNVTNGIPGLVKSLTALDVTSVMGKVRAGKWAVEESDFQLVKRIGNGAMGLVYKAKLRGVLVVAKKLKSNEGSEKARQYKDLMMELDVLLSIEKHPNLVEFYGACVADQANPVIFEEMVTGPSLEELLSFRMKPNPRSAVYSWSRDLLAALSVLHQRDPVIIHRDIKPGNLLLSKDFSTLKLTDFGMGKMVKRQELKTTEHTGHCGTRRYMAPEMFNLSSGFYDEKVDIYSTACIMWYISTGERPAMPDTSFSTRPNPDMVEWEELRDLLSRMWNPEPSSRPSALQSVEELDSMGGKPDRLQPGQIGGPGNDSGVCTIS